MTGASANGDGQAGGEQGATAGPRIPGRRQVTAALLVAMMVTAMEQLAATLRTLRFLSVRATARPGTAADPRFRITPQ